MTKRQELMTITMEECGELIQACSKSIRCDDYENNDDLKEELGDVLCMIELIKENGYFISKIFMGGTFNEIVAEGKKLFKEVKVFKPKSSRKDSKESFIICRKIR